MKLRNKQSSSRRFAIFCRARTGSYLLVDILNQFDDINCYGEIFKPGKVELPPWTAAKLATSIEDRDKYPITFVNALYGLTPRKITGMKVFSSHNEVALHYLAETKGIKKVLLTRRPVDSYISLKKAQLTHEWVKRTKNADAQSSAAKPDKDVKIQFDRVQFERYRRESEDYDQWCADLETYTGQTFFRISYEEVAAIDPVRPLAEFLGSKDRSAELKPRLEKQIKQPFEELVENYDEMKAYLER